MSDSGRGSLPTLAERRPARASLGEMPLVRVSSAETPLDTLQGSLPPPIRTVPVQALASGAGLLLATALVFLSAALRSNGSVEALEEAASSASSTTATPLPGGRATAASASAAEEPPLDRATKTELDRARVGGVEAMRALAQRYPTDPGVLRELILALGTDKLGYPEALRLAGRLFELTPEAAGDVAVQHLLVTIASGPPDPGTKAFDLIATKMGTKGPDLLFEIAAGPPNKQQLKAAALLQDPAVKKLATPALAVANELRIAFGCGRRAFFARAKESGDARSLQFVKPLLQSSGCGFLGRGDCYRCMTPADRTEAKAVIDAIEARASGGAAPAASASSAPGAPAAPPGTSSGPGIH